MQFSTEEVQYLAAMLQNSFRELSKNMDSIIQANKSVVNTSNWDSISRNHYNDELEQVIENYFTLEDHYNNILEYLVSVIENYNAISSAKGIGVFKN